MTIKWQVSALFKAHVGNLPLDKSSGWVRWAAMTWQKLLLRESSRWKFVKLKVYNVFNMSTDFLCSVCVRKSWLKEKPDVFGIQHTPRANFGKKPGKSYPKFWMICITNAMYRVPEKQSWSFEPKGGFSCHFWYILRIIIIISTEQDFSSVQVLSLQRIRDKLTIIYFELDRISYKINID